MADVDIERANSYVEQITREMMRATRKHKPMASWHEAHSVIEEEFDEFWDEVKKGGSVPRDYPALRTEVIQLAAMCLRALHDLRDDQY